MNIIQRILSRFRTTPLAVNRKIALANCAISDVAYDEAGEETGILYNYYLYLHPSGKRVIMREKEDETEYRYATGLWVNRQNLTYKYFSRI